MDSDGPTTVALTVTAEAWRDAVGGLDPAAALEAFAERTVSAVMDTATAASWLKAGEVSLLLTDDQEIRALNKAYRSHDRATNVLSFPGLDLREGHVDMAPPPGSAMLGDIVMSHECLIKEAAELEKAPIDHFAHLLVHGVLHLLGYDHDSDERAEVMEGLEAKILKTLGHAAPYAPVVEADASAVTSMSTAS